MPQRIRQLSAEPTTKNYLRYPGYDMPSWPIPERPADTAVPRRPRQQGSYNKEESQTSLAQTAIRRMLPQQRLAEPNPLLSWERVYTPTVRDTRLWKASPIMIRQVIFV